MLNCLTTKSTNKTSINVSISSVPDCQNVDVLLDGPHTVHVSLNTCSIITMYSWNKIFFQVFHRNCKEIRSTRVVFSTVKKKKKKKTEKNKDKYEITDQKFLLEWIMEVCLDCVDDFRQVCDWEWYLSNEKKDPWVTDESNFVSLCKYDIIFWGGESVSI